MLTLDRVRLPWPLLAACVLAGCSQEPPPTQPPPPVAQAVPATPAPPATLADNAALADEAAGENWLAFGRTYSQTRFSPLEQVNRETLARLAPAWHADVPGARGLVGTPLVADGVLYFNESMNRVHAVDAATGEALWSYDPKVA